MRVRRRHLVWVISAIAHVVLLAILFRAPHESPQAAEVDAISVSMLDGPPQSPAPAPAPAPPTASPEHLEPVVEPPVDVEPQYVDLSPPVERDPQNDPVALAVAAAASGAAARTCELGEWLRAALQADPTVLSALTHMPRPSRSVANAVMLWDGSWVRPDPTAASDLAAIRSAVVVGLRSAPEACRLQQVRGPELLTLTDMGGSTILAIGSGEWRWNDLLEPELQTLNAPANSRIP